MDQISLMTSNIPNHLGEAIKIILQGEDEVSLPAIKHTADKCLMLEDFVVNQFEHVMTLTGNTLETWVDALNAYENEYLEHKNIRQALRKGIDKLGELREQWTHLIILVQMVSRCIQCSLISSLHEFEKYAETAQGRILIRHSITGLMRQMIFKLAFEAATSSHLVNMMSETYVQVSQQYIMDKVSGLGKLLEYNPDTKSNQIRREGMALIQGCTGDQNGIRTFVMKRKAESEAKFKRISTELERTVKKTVVKTTKGLDQNDAA